MRADARIDFPLYHGSSTLHRRGFAVGRPPSAWPHLDGALALLRDVWEALGRHGREPEPCVVRVLEQTSAHTNWRHGLLYVTPSRLSAVRYADYGGEYGGELLTLCRHALVALGDFDDAEMSRAVAGASIPPDLLRGGGRPALVEIGGLVAGDLLPECDDDDPAQLERLVGMGADLRELLGQQVNFSVRPGAGRVVSMCRVEVERSGDAMTPYLLAEMV